jgi:predicted RNA-binding Zn-ribbon protein involved in translation (DUF1610 family)
VPVKVAPRYVFDYEDNIMRPVIESVRYCCPHCGEWMFFRNTKAQITLFRRLWFCKLCRWPLNESR